MLLFSPEPSTSHWYISSRKVTGNYGKLNAISRFSSVFGVNTNQIKFMIFTLHRRERKHLSKTYYVSTIPTKILFNGIILTLSKENWDWKKYLYCFLKLHEKGSSEVWSFSSSCKSMSFNLCRSLQCTQAQGLFLSVFISTLFLVSSVSWHLISQLLNLFLQTTSSNQISYLWIAMFASHIFLSIGPLIVVFWWSWCKRQYCHSCATITESPSRVSLSLF